MSAIWFVLWLRLLTGAVVPVDTALASAVECYAYGPYRQPPTVERYIAQVQIVSGQFAIGLPDTELNVLACIITTHLGERLLPPAIWIEDMDRAGIDDPARFTLDQPMQSWYYVAHRESRKTGRVPVVRVRVCSIFTIYIGEPDQVCLWLPTSSEAFSPEEGYTIDYHISLDPRYYGVQKTIVEYRQGVER